MDPLTTQLRALTCGLPDVASVDQGRGSASTHELRDMSAQRGADEPAKLPTGPEWSWREVSAQRDADEPLALPKALASCSSWTTIMVSARRSVDGPTRNKKKRLLVKVAWTKRR